MFPEVGELVFSLVVGYMGALEFLYVVRHLYHWSFRHNPEMRDLKSETENLQKLQDHLRNSILEASEKEALGLKAMKDGVLYKDGFRVDANQGEIDELKQKIKKQEQAAERKREIEAELAHQRKIEEETRKQLKAAEDELRRVEEEKERERLKAEREEEEKRRAEKEEEQKRQRAEEEESMRKILEAEKKIEEEHRRLEEEEEKQRLQELEEEENNRKLLAAEREREEVERIKELEAENNRKLLEAERDREERQRLQELEEENTRKILEAEREREEAERLQELEDEKIIQRLLEAERIREKEEEEEDARKLLEAERERENLERMRELEEDNSRKLREDDRELQEEQRRIEEEQARQRIEEEENYRRLLQLEREMEERERLAEEDKKALLDHAAALERETTERLLAAEREAELKQQQIEENEETMRKLLEAERELELRKQEMEEEAENLRRLIEAEKEMEERQRRIDEEALQKLKNAQEEVELRQTYDTEVKSSEQPFEKKEIGQSELSPTPTQTVKTQYGQTGSDSLKSKAILFPDVSEESSSAEPVSSKQSSFSTQQSSEAVLPEVHFDEYERQAPDGGEDIPSLQYSDDYLRSLDGIKNKPLVREDGSGRRRAFKKRRSSGSSTSSRESRASREEELKMFTSLEEEEFENIRKGDTDYETIKYTSEPNLKVGKQHRRHKRSPAKDAKRDTNDAAKGSLEMLDEEDPWGEVKPEHYKDTEFWQRERNTSIDEELEANDAKQLVQLPSLSAVNIPKMSSFEEATQSQHKEAISALQRQRSKDPDTIQEPEAESDKKNTRKD